MGKETSSQECPRSRFENFYFSEKRGQNSKYFSAWLDVILHQEEITLVRPKSRGGC